MATKKNQSELARATEDRGRDPGGVIAQQVVDRIVSNSTQEFQDYLAQAGQGSAMENAAAIAPPEPSTAQPMAMPAMPFSPPIAPAPAGPPALMPFAPPSTATPPMSASPLPPMPMLNPLRPAPVDPNMQALLRMAGLI